MVEKITIAQTRGSVYTLKVNKQYSFQYPLRGELDCPFYL
jgi:hypothetical protein